MSTVPDFVARKGWSSILHQVVTPPPGAIVLLCGSTSEALATSASDVDFLIALPERQHLRWASGLRNVRRFRATCVDRYLILAGGPEIDIEVLRPQFVGWLIAVMRNVRNVLDNSGRSGVVPMLQPLELRLLIRLCNGLPLAGAAMLRRLHRDLGLHRLPELLVLTNFVMAMAYLEDSHSMRETAAVWQGRSALLAAARAAEHILLAWLASVGVLAWDTRFAPAYLDRLKSSGSDLPESLRNLKDLVLPARSEGSAFLDRAHDCAVRFFEQLERRNEMPGVVRFVRAFGRDRWKTDLSFLKPSASPGTSVRARTRGDGGGGS